MVVADVVKCLMCRDRERGLSAGERKLPATLGSAGNMSSDLLNMQR